MTSRPKSPEVWSPTRYLAFNNERMKPALDLIHNISKHDMNGKRIVDLGCGPGNSTQALAATWPDADVTGIDSSEPMLERARADAAQADGTDASRHIRFERGDFATWMPADGDANAVDLFFSNAAFHWLRRPERIPAMVRLFRSQRPGGVFAFQVPDNYDEPSHALMREVALLPGRAWTDIFLEAGVGYHGALPKKVRDAGVMASRPDLDPIEPAEEYYDAFMPYASDLEIWKTTYSHVLPGPAHIVAWVESSGLMPYLSVLPTDAMRAEFKAEYLDRIARAYRKTYDGKVILRYPRRFLVAQRK
ncbi:uncharacterized protein PpBr36_06202 [Pyricularia pennisetigena]|uniref:uncharacterized protein n=1 Tax=Pyricularia pennisetigena TaxID=1578925 RepID=UPI00114DBC38|nr:uncharacterized protein PpBr36_06202 [Pyricularia pennisetigena]TLS23207.1 hypothetical protein PpBr36_06202 [Pyricularia pennisetigena]